MAGLMCLCGRTLSDHNPGTEGLFFDLRDVYFAIEKESFDGVAFVEKGRSVWECISCGRLAFSWPDNKSLSIKWYAPVPEE